MCAINGFSFSDKNLIEKMNSATRHRGPDGTGIFVNNAVSIGHNLLSITETPERSKQPWTSPDQRYVLSYNGEIYNYELLRAELIKQGDTFETNADTEVLFKGLVRHGADFIEKLDGMFAFAFYDAQGQTIVLARDRLGIKPLYYVHKNGRLIFSSELRGILTHPIDRLLDMKGTAVYLAMGYIPGDRTLIQDVMKVAVGQYLVFNLATDEQSTHWYAARKEISSEPFEPSRLRNIISTAVEEHTMGLRPFGLYLSGGLDSSIILHELTQHHDPQKIHAYSTRFDVNDDRFNEDAHIAQKLGTAYNIQYHELLVTEQNFIETLTAAIETIEEPRYNYSIPTYWLTAQRVSKDQTVVLSGSGGDEIFMGYSKYATSREISKLFDQIPFFAANAWHSVKATLAGASFLPRLRLERTLDRWMYITNTGAHPKTIAHAALALPHNKLRAYLRNNGRNVLDANDPDIENNIAGFDRAFWLADEEFLRTDKTAMHFGMEGRFPLVARNIIEYAERIPSSEKLSGRKTKDLMRRAYQDKLPSYVLEKKKTGWSSPAGPWMASKLYDVVKDVLSPNYYPETASLFNLPFIHKRYLPQRGAITNPELKQFWPIFAFQIWAKSLGIKRPA